MMSDRNPNLPSTTAVIISLLFFGMGFTVALFAAYLTLVHLFAWVAGRW